MAMLNVDPEKQADAFYRYKMPRVIIKVEGNGNGIKTVICNIAEIAQRLARNVEYPMRFFAHELAATSKLKDDKWILTGSHNQDAIQTCIFDFIKRFVLCKACRNPETVIRVDDKKNIFLDCKACSRTTDISPSEKLCNAITKYEKPVSSKPEKEPKEKDKKDKKSKKEKGKEEKKEKKSKDQEEEETLDQKTRQVDDKDVIISEEIDKPHPVHLLREFVNAEPPPTIDDFVGKVLDIKEEYGFTEDKLVVRLVFEALFDKDIGKQFSSRHKMMARFVKVSVEKELISNLMHLCAAEELLRAKFHILLKKFYDGDLISSESIIEWHEKKKCPKGIDKDVYSSFKKKTTDFVEWLQQDDDDDSEDDDDEDEDEAPATNGKAVPVASKPKAPAKEEDDDIDIDAI